MSKSGGNTQTVSASGPPEFQLPYIKNMMSEAERLYKTGGPQFYSGPMTAGFNPLETQAQGQITQAAGAGGGLQNVADSTLKGFNWGLTGALDVANNPFLKESVTAATQPVVQQLTQATLPSLRASAMGSGNLGSTRSGLAEALAVDSAQKNILNTSSQMYNQAYNRGLDTFDRTLSQAPMVGSQVLAPSMALSDVGAQQRAMAQSGINEDVMRWMYQQNLPFQNLKEFANTVNGSYGAQGMTQSTAPQTGTPEQIGSLLTALLPFASWIFK